MTCFNAALDMLHLSDARHVQAQPPSSEQNAAGPSGGQAGAEAPAGPELPRGRGHATGTGRHVSNMLEAMSALHQQDRSAAELA